MDKRRIAVLRGVVLLCAAVSGMAFADTGGVPECAKQKSTFDGITPLQYATVKGDSGSRLYFHPEHPSMCPSADEGACKGKAYVVPGDTVAVGNTCGDWAYAQYIGEKSVTTGWVEPNRLDLSSMSKLESETKQPREITTDDKTPYMFKLIRGNGKPVCVAYLQRLNHVESYGKPPYCGRPEDDSVPGFTKLNRVPLPIADVNRLIGSVYNFTNPWYPDHEWAVQPDGTKKLQPTWPPFAEDRILPIWQYMPPVDIDNDGKPDNVVVWQSDTDIARPTCGIIYRTVPHGSRPSQLAYILTPNNQAIDEAASKEKLAHATGGHHQHDDHGHEIAAYALRPIGRLMSIFEFRGTYYFDTFFTDDVDLDDNPVSESTLGVFLRKNGETREMCRYQMSDFDANQ